MVELEGADALSEEGIMPEKGVAVWITVAGLLAAGFQAYAAGKIGSRRRCVRNPGAND